ncbi:MAG: helix-turn-helix transcriptional regulator [Syntrophomonadaceae bacterium]|nr:helix-turn-helix transcriptional regulator [Syntrophomonadaceae bacterium]
MNIPIKHYRLLRGWSQSRLARESGVSQTYISELEAGKWSPNLSVLRKLAAALEIPVVALLDEEIEGGDEHHVYECSSGYEVGLCF